MKKIMAILLSLLLFTLIFGCGGEKLPPKPGDWTASAGFGNLEFIVDYDSASIAEITFHFNDFECGGKWTSASKMIQKYPGWPIEGGRFRIEHKAINWNFVIEGKFDKTGMRATGTWRIIGYNCSGNWESSRED